MPRAFRMMSLLAREVAFRAWCRHRQGSRPNILLHCTRRSGSTWLLNTIAAHPGMRYVGRPLLAVQESRWGGRMPDLALAAQHHGEHGFRQIIGFRPEQMETFRLLAEDIFSGRLPLYPAMNVRAPYFHRVTDRIIFQMTSGQPLIEWFDEHLDVTTAILFRHPIPTALSVMRAGWPDDCRDFLLHHDFVEQHVDESQRTLAERVIASGSELERHVLDWTLHMLVPYRVMSRHDWLVVTYEDLVREPGKMLERVSSKLDLPDLEAMHAQLAEPSRTVTDTTVERRDDPEYVLNRWRERVPEDEVKRLMEIPHAFGIGMYE